MALTPQPPARRTTLVVAELPRRCSRASRPALPADFLVAGGAVVVAVAAAAELLLHAVAVPTGYVRVHGHVPAAAVVAGTTLHEPDRRGQASERGSRLVGTGTHEDAVADADADERAKTLARGSSSRRPAAAGGVVGATWAVERQAADARAANPTSSLARNVGGAACADSGS